MRDKIVAAAAAAAAPGREVDGEGGVLERRGYVVYRGVCAAVLASTSSAAVDVAAAEGSERERDWCLESFQTWGSGLRFASVPLAGDKRVS